MNFESLFTIYYNQFLHEFGERKIRKITEIINNSKHTKSLLDQCNQKRFAPTATDLRQCILCNIKLSFSTKPTEFMAMAILLKKFNDEINIDNYLASDEEVVKIYNRFNNTFTY